MNPMKTAAAPLTTARHGQRRTAGRRSAQNNPAQSNPGQRTDRSRQEDGFTLAEVIVSIALFTIMSVAATTALVSIVRLTNTSENRVLAANIAREQIESLRLANSTSASVLDEGSHDVLLKSKTFTVVTTLNPTAGATCAAGASRLTTVTVSAGGKQLVRYDAVLAC